MQPIPSEARVKNVSLIGAKRERCYWCADCGYVVAQTRRDPIVKLVEEDVDEASLNYAPESSRNSTDYWPIGHRSSGKKWVRRRVGDTEPIDEMAPCPFCERGGHEEFGDAENQTRSAPVLPPWDLREGFWKGRDTAIIPVESLATRTLSREESAERLLELRERMGWIAKDVES